MFKITHKEFKLLGIYQGYKDIDNDGISDFYNYRLKMRPMGKPIFESTKIPCTIERNPIIGHEASIGEGLTK